MTINIAGVPEHFNLPWHLAIEEGLFAEKGIDLQWTDYSGGTGAMCKALRSGKTDLAVLLTEGIITDIVKGNPSRIIHSYVSSPLIWGIFVPADSPYQTLADTKGKTYAISRMRSGSHLMAYVDYQQRNWNTDSLKFEVVGG
ncbi:MAG: ABC transporter substrate-binding protein, partial [Chitinophagales bacterium]